MAEFAANGGCKCMNDGNDCDVADFIPVGCHKCGEKAGEYCQSGSGKMSSRHAHICNSYHLFISISKYIVAT